MAGPVVWSEEALDDIDAIAAYIARDSVTHAQRFVSEALDLADLLVTQPRMGRRVPELRQDRVREHFIYKMTTRERILIDSQVCHGRPVIRGTRVPVAIVVGSLAGGMDLDEIAREYDLTQDDIRATLAFATELVNEESFPRRKPPLRDAGP